MRYEESLSNSGEWQWQKEDGFKEPCEGNPLSQWRKLSKGERGWRMGWLMDSEDMCVCVCVCV